MSAPAPACPSGGGGENALDLARRAFRFLVSASHPIGVDGRAIAGWPARLVPMDEVAARVLHRRCPQSVRDQVWRQLVTRARSEGGAWTLSCVGVALPALTTIAARLTGRFAADPADIHAAVLAGFLAAVGEVDLEAARIMNRLRWAAYRSGHAALREALDAPEPGATVGAEGAAVGRAAAGHPDLVLARAVADGVLAPREADLIAATRLDGHPLTRLAEECGGGYEALKKARARAERRLAAHLTPYRPPAPHSRPRERSSLEAASAARTAGWSR